MYLSRVKIDFLNRKIKDLNYVNGYHKWVEGSFKEEFGKERSRKLWRIDRLNGESYLLLVSQNPPNLMELEKYGVKDSPQSKNYDAFLNSIKNNNKYRFRVTLNPVYCSSNGKGVRGSKKPITKTEEQIKYLIEKSVNNGFSVESDGFSIVEKGNELLDRQGKRIKLVKAVYEGILTVTDAEIFKETLVGGLGKRKAFGFGMMTVIPLVK